MQGGSTWQRSSLVASISPSMVRPPFSWVLIYNITTFLVLKKNEMKAPVNVVLHPARHHVACPLVHGLDGFDDLQRYHRLLFIIIVPALVVHLEKLGGGGLLVVHVVAHQVLVLIRQQQGHLRTIKAQIGSFKSLLNLGPHCNQVVGKVLQQLKITITMISFNIDINVVIMALAIIPAQWSS